MKPDRGTTAWSCGPLVRSRVAQVPLLAGLFHGFAWVSQNQHPVFSNTFSTSREPLGSLGVTSWSPRFAGTLTSIERIVPNASTRFRALVPCPFPLIPCSTRPFHTGSDTP